MNNPNQNDQNQQQQGGQQDQGGQQGGRAKAASSRVGRTSPVSKVVSSADLKSKARQTPGLFSAEKRCVKSGGFGFLIDHTFGDFR